MNENGKETEDENKFKRHNRKLSEIIFSLRIAVCWMKMLSILWVRNTKWTKGFECLLSSMRCVYNIFKWMETASDVMLMLLLVLRHNYCYTRCPYEKISQSFWTNNWWFWCLLQLLFLSCCIELSWRCLEETSEKEWIQSHSVCQCPIEELFIKKTDVFCSFCCIKWIAMVRYNSTYFDINT